MSPRWHKALSDVLSSKTRTVLVVLSIAVGVFAVGTIMGAQAMVSEDLNRDYVATNPSSAVIFTERFDEDLLAALRRVPGVALAEGRRRGTVELETGDGETRSLRLEVVSDDGDLQLNKVRPEEGEWPPRFKDLLIERASLSLTNAAIGDTVTVELPDGRVRQLRITGTTHDLGKPPAAFVGTPYGYVTHDTLEWLGFAREFSELHIVVEGDRNDKEHIKSVVDAVQAKIERSGRTVRFAFIPEPGEHPANQALQPLLRILGILGGLSMVLSGFLVINTISALLTQQIRQIGIMKTIGARVSQLVAMYLVTVAVYGVLALLIAVPLGALAGFAFAEFMASMINFDTSGFRIPLQVFLWQVALGMGVPLAAAVYPIYSGVRTTIREAISTSSAGPQFGLGLVDRTLARIKGFPRPTLLSLRNTFRRKSRLGLTLFTLTLGGATFIAVLSVHASLLATLDDALSYWGFDIGMSLSRPYRVAEIERQAMLVPGVSFAESWSRATGRVIKGDGTESENIGVLGIPWDTEVINPTLLRGRWLVEGDERALVINTDVVEAGEGVDVGDELTLSLNGKEVGWTVVGVVRGVLSGPIAYVNYPYLARLANNPERASSVQIVTSTTDTEAQAEIANRLEEQFEAAGMKVGSTITFSTLREQIEFQFQILVLFLVFMAILLAVVGGLGLAGTMSMNVLERSREIGVMRAIGAADRSVLQIFLAEGLLIGILSWACGALISIPVAKGLTDAVGIAFLRAPLTFAFSLEGAFGWLVIVLVLSGLASLLPSWRASRVTVREVLAYE